MPWALQFLVKLARPPGAAPFYVITHWEEWTEAFEHYGRPPNRLSAAIPLAATLLLRPWWLRPVDGPSQAVPLRRRAPAQAATSWPAVSDDWPGMENHERFVKPPASRRFGAK